MFYLTSASTGWAKKVSPYWSINKSHHT